MSNLLPAFMVVQTECFAGLSEPEDLVFLSHRPECHPTEGSSSYVIKFSEARNTS